VSESASKPCALLCAFSPRAQAVGAWSKDTCCQGSANRCYNAECDDETSSADSIFRLQPGDPERFLPTGTSPTGGHPTYQYVKAKGWPQWGYNYDLNMGDDGPPGAGSSRCDQGGTYAGSPNEVCGGGYGTWGKTDLEVWRLVD